jgi:Domain of unknown function (DUF4399)
MNQKLILPAALFFILAACNNSASDDKKPVDTTTATSQDDMHHDATTTGTIPDLPAIPEGAKVFFKNLKDGATVSSPFKIEMGVDVMRIDTAGPVVAGSGHHHLLIDVADPIAAGTITPKDSTHLHFGKGQTETELTLSPGKHKLTLQFADGLHRSYGGRLSSTITVNVKK